MLHVKPTCSLLLNITGICLLEVLCFLEVDMNYLQTRLCKLKKSELTNRGSCLWILVVSMLFTVSLIFQTSPRVERLLRLAETAKIQASLLLNYSPLFFRQIEDCDCCCHSGLIWASPVTLYFPLFVLKRCSPSIFQAQA